MISETAFRAFSEELEKIAGFQELAAERLSKKDLALYKLITKAIEAKINRSKKARETAKAYGGGFYDQVKNEVVTARDDYRILAHEGGHADIQKTLVGKVIQSPLARVSFGLTPLAAVGAAILAAKGKMWGLALPVATTVPTLISEAWATSRGGGKLEDAKADEKQKDRYKELMRSAFGTYLKVPATSAVLGGLTFALEKARAV